MAYKGFPKAMVIAGSVLIGILIAEAAFVIVKGVEKKSAPTVSSLTVKGTQLYSGSSEAVFNGISFGWHNLWPRFYNAEALTALHNDWGCNIFRAAIGADSLGELLNGTTNHPGYIEDPDGALSCLYSLIDAAIANDCYIIVDWHSHLLHLQEATEFFTAVATRYKGVPNVIYELFNEPVSRSNEQGLGYVDLGDPEAMMAYWQDLKAYATSLIGTITSIDPSKPLILMGCPCWDQRIDLCAADPVTGYDNLMYTVHFYAATHKKELRDACDGALAAGIPIFISECASCEASGDGPMDLESWAAWDNWADANGISMLTWSISDKVETCSMFTGEATSEGPWAEDVIKPWGKIVKDWVK